MDFEKLAEEFIASMEWLPSSTEREKKLVIGNVRGFAIMAQIRYDKTKKEELEKLEQDK